MARKFNLGLGAAALVLLASCGIVVADGPVMVGPGGAKRATEGGCAAESCCPTEGCCKSCIPTPVPKKVTLRHYGVKCEDFCLCKPTFLGGLLNIQEARQKDYDLYQGRGPCDQPCGECGGECGCCTNCGSPRIKKYLLIHNRVHEECEVKCMSPDQIAAMEPAKPAAAPGTPKAAPGENPQPRTPGLDPGTKTTK